MTETIATALMFVMLGVSLLTDRLTGKIYNLVTAPCALTGLALGMVAGGFTGAADHLLGMMGVAVVMLVLSPLAKFGGGDTKLLMAVGALQGVHFVLWALLWTGVAGGALALMTLVRRRMVRQTATNMAANLLSRAVGVPTDLAEGSSLGKMHYSLAIGLGALLTFILGAGGRWP